MKNKILYSSIRIIPALLPFTALAQDPTQVDDIVEQTRVLFNSFIIPFAFVLLTVIFLWGVVKYVLYSQDEKAREGAKTIMTWGIIGLAVAAAAWGIVQILTIYFGVGGVNLPGGGEIPLPIQ